MIDDEIPIGFIGNFLFCPYSIYLNTVYMDSDESVFQAEHLVKGTIIHHSIDSKELNNKKNRLLATPVYSEKLGLIGKIDIFNIATGELIERKTKVDKIYPRHIYQLWAQMFCLQEMGYEVKKLTLYDYTKNIKHDIKIPNSQEIHQFEHFLKQMRAYNPESTQIDVVDSKCKYCIFNNLCDKTTVENVYS